MLSTVLTAIAQINHILESEDAAATVAALLAPAACIAEVDDDETLQQRYQDALVARKRERMQVIRKKSLIPDDLF